MCFPLILNGYKQFEAQRCEWLWDFASQARGSRFKSQFPHESLWRTAVTTVERLSGYRVHGRVQIWTLSSGVNVNVNLTPSACGRIMSSVYDKNVGIIAKHTLTPCWLKWAERCQRTPLSCPPNSWSRGPASPERQMLWLHSRTGPSETSTEVYCLHTLWCQILGRNTPYFTDIDRGVLSSYFMMSILGAEHSVLYRADMHA